MCSSAPAGDQTHLAVYTSSDQEEGEVVPAPFDDSIHLGTERRSKMATMAMSAFALLPSSSSHSRALGRAGEVFPQVPAGIRLLFLTAPAGSPVQPVGQHQEPLEDQLRGFCLSGCGSC